jgi:hypothetical protein
MADKSHSPSGASFAAERSPSLEQPGYTESVRKGMMLKKYTSDRDDDAATEGAIALAAA